MGHAYDFEVERALGEASPEDRLRLSLLGPSVEPMDLKKALSEAEGDVHKTVEILEARARRLRRALGQAEADLAGLEKAVKPASRATKAYGITLVAVSTLILFTILIAMAVEGDVVPLLAAVITPVFVGVALLLIGRPREERLSRKASLPAVHQALRALASITSRQRR